MFDTRRPDRGVLLLSGRIIVSMCAAVVFVSGLYLIFHKDTPPHPSPARVVHTECDKSDRVFTFSDGSHAVTFDPYTCSPDKVAKDGGFSG